MLPGSLRKKYRERTTFEEFIFYAFGMGVAIKVRPRPYLVFSFPFHSSRTMEEKTDLSLLSSPYLT